MKNRELLLKVLSIMLLISFSVLIFSLVYKNKLPMIVEQINNGTIGVILTAIVTVLLLGQQSQSEEVKERNSKIFEKKLEVYHKFIQELERIIQDGKITLGERANESDELSTLLFQLAQIKMHTSEPKVLQILESVSNIKSANKSGDQGDANKIDHKHLVECLFEIVNTLRWELYPKLEERENPLHEQTNKSVASFNVSVDKIINWAKDSTGEENNKKGELSVNDLIPLTDNNRNQIIKAFEDKVVEELQKRLKDEDWIILSEGSDRINVTLSNKKWIEKTTKIGIFDYPDADRLCFATWYNGKGFYKDVYLMIRRELSGRYNRYNWWRNFKEPYNKWDENCIGISAVQNKEEEFIKYITDELVKIAIQVDELVSVYEIICQLQQEIPKTELMSNQWIFESCCLVHDYEINGRQLASDAYYTIEDGWEISFFGRGSENMNYLHNLILKYPNFKSAFIDAKPDERFYYPTLDRNVDISAVSQILQKLLNDFEVIIKSESNKTES